MTNALEEYRLLSFSTSSGEPRAGVLINERVYELTELKKALDLDMPSDSVLAVLEEWELTHAKLKTAAQRLRKNAECAPSQPINQVSLETPVLHPGALFCAWSGPLPINHLKW